MDTYMPDEAASFLIIDMFSLSSRMGLRPSSRSHTYATPSTDETCGTIGRVCRAIVL